MTRFDGPDTQEEAMSSPSGAMHDDAIDRAKVRGHSVVYDGPTIGGADRWTCTRCGRAILKAWGPFYGSAKDEECAA